MKLVIIRSTDRSRDLHVLAPANMDGQQIDEKVDEAISECMAAEDDDQMYTDRDVLKALQARGFTPAPEPHVFAGMWETWD